MKKLLTLVVALVMVLSAVFALVACGNTNKPNDGDEELTGTAKVVAEASKMTLEQLKAASKKEIEESNDTFKVVGLTSVLDKTLLAFAKEYDWIKYEKEKDENGKDVVKAGSNAYCKNDYKDYTLLTALNTAETKYVADFALVQDVRSIASIDGDLLHNYVPSDYKELGLTDKDIKPLKGIYFNKVFWTNSNFETVNGGLKLYNIWQMAGTSADKGHISKVSFQNASTEQINMSFLLSAEAPENQKRIEDAYQKFYGKAWSAEESEYASAGQQWVTEFIANISRFHSSDGTAMKETQLRDDWNAGYVYYGAFAKMKDAVGKTYTVAGSENDPILKDLMGSDGKINAMDTVKWDWTIEGFNGFMYAMCSQVVNNAKHPYTACLYARYLCTLQAYEGSIYNASLPINAEGNKDKTPVNQYGYYYPAGNDITYAYKDWTRDVHLQKELVEDYDYLKSTKISQVNRILGLISANKAS